MAVAGDAAFTAVSSDTQAKADAAAYAHERELLEREMEQEDKRHERQMEEDAKRYQEEKELLDIHHQQKVDLMSMNYNDNLDYNNQPGVESAEQYDTQEYDPAPLSQADYLEYASWFV